MKTKDNILDNNSKLNNKYSIIFFIFITIITIALISYNYILKQDILSINEQIEQRTNSINEINKDKSIGLYNLINTNRKTLAKLEKRSQITNFIDHLNGISSKYNLEVEGFNYDAGILHSSINILNNTEMFAYNIAQNFISNYRKDDTNMFELGFVDSIKGNDNIKFDIKLKLKD